MADYTLTTLGVGTELLDLPFGQPLEEWDDPRIVQVPRGISRHVVRFVRVHGQILAIKEATERYVLREHQLLHELADRSVPVVDTFGTVTDRRTEDGEELGGLLITRHLPFSLPYRSLFTGRGVPNLRSRLLDSLAELFVRIHLAGFFWGDCSLSNTLFRRDAGALAAHLVDAETGELHDRLSDGQRNYDITIATENIAGELLDLQAAGKSADDVDPFEHGHGARAAVPETVGRTRQRRHIRKRRELPDRPADQTSARAGFRCIPAGDSLRRRGAQAAFRYPRRRARPPSAAPVPAHRPAGAGEPGEGPAVGPGAFPGEVDRGHRHRHTRRSGRPSMAGREVLRHTRARPAGPTAQAARRRAVPRDQRTPLVPLRDAGPRRGPGKRCRVLRPHRSRVPARCEGRGALGPRHRRASGATDSVSP